MDLRLHANATTTPKTRALIQASPLSPREMAELGVSVSTVRRWRRRDFQQDASHTPHHLATTLTPAHEAVAVELRRTLERSLDALCRSSSMPMRRARDWIAACAGMA